MPSGETEAVYQAVGAKVRMIREAIGMTQMEFSELLRKNGSSLNRPSIANIEAGRQRFMLHDLLAMAKVLGCSPKHILKGIWW